MLQVLEYIKQNYTLFLFVVIIILLAVIGYYAEKTNFGQGKENKKKDENNADGQIDFNKDSVVSVEKEEEKKEILLNDNSSKVLNNSEIQDVKTKLIENIENQITHSKKAKKELNPIIDVIHKELNLVNTNSIYNEEEIKNKEIKNKKKEEEFNKLNDEFDELLPKREFINGDLLSEIEDLELGKTQKFDLSDLRQFDNIKLPRISDTVTEEQEIWKI
jgi:hypothetical protein